MKLFTFREMRRFGLNATDGLVGFVKESLFDDAGWMVRYLVADTGNWLTGQLVLISPHSVGHADAEDASFEVSLTKQQVEDSPPISADKPVSRQKEEALAEYFQWPAYWMSDPAGVGLPPTDVPRSKSESAGVPPPKGDPHLRSSREVIGYRIEAADGDIGHVHDFVVDIDAWRIEQMVIDTRNWLPGRKVLIAPSLVSDIRWSDRHVRVALPRDVIKDSPEYDPSQPLSEAYFKQLTDYYNRPVDLP